MRRTSLYLIIFFSSLILHAQGATERIGASTWYTEGTPFARVLQAARRSGKPVLAVFSATWCGPCQMVKKNLFARDDFRRVAAEVVLFHVEQTVPAGLALVKEHGVKVFPTFSLFAADGSLLESAAPTRTVEGFLAWIKEVRSGEYPAAWERRLKANPRDRELALRLADRFAAGEEQAVKLRALGYRTPVSELADIRRAIGFAAQAARVNPDPSDALTQKASEKAALWLMENWIPFRFAHIPVGRENHELVLRALAAYLPGKARYELATNRGVCAAIDWLAWAGNDRRRAMDLFHSVMASRGGDDALQSNIDLLLAGLGKFREPRDKLEWRNWLNRLGRYVDAHERQLKGHFEFVTPFSKIVYSAIFFFDRWVDRTEAEAVGRQFFPRLERLDADATEYLWNRTFLASEQGILVEETIRDGGRLLDREDVGVNPNMVIFFAELLYKKGRSKEANARLQQAVSRMLPFGRKPRPQISAPLLNRVAWTMVANKDISARTVEIAEKARSLLERDDILDTLARAYAGVGRLREAIATERKALQITRNEQWKPEFKKNISAWEKKLAELSPAKPGR